MADEKDEEEDDNGAVSGPRHLRKKEKHAGSGGLGGRRLRGDEHLPPREKPKERSAETQEMLLACVKKDRFCGFLEEASMKSIVDSMRYYVFQSGEEIVRQYEDGRYFFIVDEGKCKVFSKGVESGQIGEKGTFGAIALLYNCPRTATVVADGPVSVWAADGDSFRHVLKATAHKQYEDNLRFLHYITWFNALSSHQKERICKMALRVQAYDAGATVIEQGDPPSAVYVVKKGEASAIINGKKVGQMCTGDTFGERSVVSGTAHTASVITEGPCEFVCLRVKGLKEALGEDLVACLEGPFIQSVLKTLPLVAHFSEAQLYEFVQAMKVQSYAAEAALPEDLPLVVVINGSISAEVKGETVTVGRGRALRDWSTAALGGEESGGASYRQLVACSEGARIASITKDSFSQVLQNLGFLRVDKDEATGDALRKKFVIKEVHIFRDLTPNKVDLLIDRMALKKYQQGAQVIRQGDIGSTFFIIKSGEIRIVRDGVAVKALGPNASFGERALLMDEVRSANAEVASEVAHLWSIDKETFTSILSDYMRELLQKKIQLQDTTVKLRMLEHMRIIGLGSFGSVRMVQHRWTKMRYALKRVLKEDGAIPPALQNEVELLKCVDHPFVMGLVRTFDSARSVYILTELITGGQLYDHLGRMGILGRKQAQFYAGSIVLALEALHSRNIVYRDLKPENVLLDSHGYLKLIDFGLAKKLDTALPVTYSVVGTPAYIAPEVVTSNGHGFACDVWSLGVMIYEFVIGTLPFANDGDISDVIAAILEEDLRFPAKYNDSSGKRLLVGLLNKDPAQRLGCGVDGWQKVKEQKFFKQGLSGDLFSMLMSHEMEPPVVPESETYTDELEDEVSLSDAHLLFCDT